MSSIINFPKKFYNELHIKISNEYIITKRDNVLVNDNIDLNLILRYWLNVIPTSVGCNINIVLKIPYENDEVVKIRTYTYDFLKSIDVLEEDTIKQLNILEYQIKKVIPGFVLHDYIRKELIDKIKIAVK